MGASEKFSGENMKTLCSSIGKKQLMGVTGLALCGFVLSHMLGNLLYLAGPDAYNAYGHAITGNKPIYYPIELGLLAFFVLHVLFAILVTLENKRARPIAYAVNPGMGTKGAASLASKTMIQSGMLIFVFVVWHLIQFRFGVYYPFEHKGEEIRDLHLLMTEIFAGTGYVAWYVFSLAILGLHLSHAFWSAFQTLAIIPPGKESCLRGFSKVFGWGVALGFAINPIWIFFKG